MPDVLKFDIRLRLYTPAGVKGKLLPAQTISMTDPEGDAAVLSFQVSEKVAGRILQQPFVVAVEYAKNGGAWVEPLNGRFVAKEDSIDTTDEAGVVSFTGIGIVPWLLARALLGWTKSAKNNERTWTAQTAGYIMTGALLEAHNRGWAPYLTASFSNTLDSNGVAWPTAAADKITQTYPLLTPVWQVLGSLLDGGMCEMASQGTVLHMYNANGGTDHTKAANGIVKFGTNAKSIPVKTSFDNVFTDITIVPEKARSWLYLNNPGADTTFGRLEASMTQSGVKDHATATKLAKPTMDLGKTSKREISATYDVEGATYMPWIDYNKGDQVLARTRGGWESVRVVELAIAKDAEGGVTVTTIMAQRFKSMMARIAKKTGTATVGSVTGGSGIPLPAGRAPNAEIPAAPTGLATLSNIGVWDLDGAAKSQITIQWDLVTDAIDTTDIDIDTYEVWSRTGTAAAQRILATEGLVATISGLQPLTPTWFKVRARSFSGDWSAFSAELAITTNRPTDVLLAPASPVVTQKLGVVSVAWDGLLAGGGTLPAQFLHAYVAMSTTQAGTYEPIGQQLGRSGTITVANIPVGQTRWFKLYAVDRQAVVSAASAAVSITVLSVDFSQLDASIQNAVTTAQTTADGKNTVYYQIAAPGLVGNKINDVWYDADDGYRMYRWDGAAWTALSFGSAALADLAITAAKIAANTITTSQLAAGAVATGNLAANAVDATKLATAVNTSLGRADAALPKILGSGTGKIFQGVLAYTMSVNADPNLLIIETPITGGNYMCRIKMRGYNYAPLNTEVDLDVGFYFTSTPVFANTGYTTAGSKAVKVQLARNIATGTVALILTPDPSSPNWHYLKLNITEAIIGHTTAPDSFLNGWSAALKVDTTGYDMLTSPPARDINDTNDLTQGWRTTGQTTIAGGQITADSVTAAQIAANAITANELAAGAVIAGKIAAGTIVAADIAAGTITAAKIAAGTITTKQMVIGDFANIATINELTGSTVTSYGQTQISAGWNSLVDDAGGQGYFMFSDQRGPIPFLPEESLYYEFTAVATTAATGVSFGAWTYYGAGGVTNSATPNFTIGTAEQKYSGVLKTHLYDIAATQFVIGLQGVAGKGIKIRKVSVRRMSGGELIVDGAITANELAAGAVIAGKIAAGTIVAADIAAGTITSAEILAGTITASDMAVGTITAASGILADAVIVNANIADGTILNAKIGTLDAAKITTGVIVAAQLGASSVLATKIAAGAIEAQHISLGAVLPSGTAINRIPAPMTDIDYWTLVKTGAIPAATFNPLGVLNWSTTTITTAGTQLSTVTTVTRYATIVALTKTPMSGRLYVKALGLAAAAAGTYLYIRTYPNEDGTGTVVNMPVYAPGEIVLTAGHKAYQAYIIANAGVVGTVIANLEIFEVIGEGATGQQSATLSPEGIRLVSDDGAGVIDLTTNSDNFFSIQKQVGVGYEPQASIDSSGDGVFQNLAVNTEVTVRGAALLGSFEDISRNGALDDGAIFDRNARGVVLSGYFTQGALSANTAAYRGLAAFSFTAVADRRYQLQIDSQMVGVNPSTTGVAYVEILLSASPIDISATTGYVILRTVSWSSITEEKGSILQMVKSFDIAAAVSQSALKAGTNYILIRTRNTSGSSITLGTGGVDTHTVSILDVGPTFDSYFNFTNNTSAGVPAAPATARTVTYAMAWSRSWNSGGGAIVSGTGQYTNAKSLYQGLGASSMGAMMGWNSLGLAGKTAIKIEVYMRNRHTYTGGAVNVRFGTSTAGYTVPATHSTANAWVQGWGKGVGAWVTIPSSLWAGIIAGTIKSLALGISGSASEYAYFDGVGLTDPPKLRVTYK